MNEGMIKMSNWKREYGTNEKGQRTIVITENTEPVKPYAPLFVRMNISLMKIAFFVGLGLLIPLAILINVLS